MAPASISHENVDYTHVLTRRFL